MNIAKQAKLIAKSQKREWFIYKCIRKFISYRICHFIKHRNKDLNDFLIKFCIFVVNYPQFYKDETKFRFDCEDFFVEINTISNKTGEYIMNIYTRGEKFRRADITLLLSSDFTKSHFNYISESVSYSSTFAEFTEEELFDKMVDISLRVLSDMTKELITNNKIYYIY